MALPVPEPAAILEYAVVCTVAVARVTRTGQILLQPRNVLERRVDDVLFETRWPPHSAADHTSETTSL